MKTIKVLHGGATGVDRGAHYAARDNGWEIGGFMPSNRRDELGPIPEDVARYLTALHVGGLAARTEANVTEADALLVVVPDAEDPKATPGTRLTLELAARRSLPRLIVDPTTLVTDLARWIRGLQRGGLQLTLDKRGAFDVRARPEVGDHVRLMVAGPRASRWSIAQFEIASLLRRVKLALAELDAPHDLTRRTSSR